MNQIIVNQSITEPFTELEVRNYIKALKNGKAPGPDNIPNEFYKEGGETIIKDMKILSNNILKEENVPEIWNYGKTVLLHKGGLKPKNLIQNYRPITLTDNIGKIFCGLLKNRLNKQIEENNIISDEQNGFRENRRGTDNIYILNEIIENAKENNRKLILTFLDIEKAYDKVNRELLWKILERAGIENKIRNIIQSLYKNTRIKVKLNEIETDWISGVGTGGATGALAPPIIFQGAPAPPI